MVQFWMNKALLFVVFLGVAFDVYARPLDVQTAVEMKQKNDLGAFQTPSDLKENSAYAFSYRDCYIQTGGKMIHLNVEVADTPALQATGLMFRTSLAPNKGMLFIAPQDRMWHMWMKNTLIPLDMIFIDNDGKVVKIVSDTRPQDLTLVSSDEPVRAVLEIGGGQAKNLGISVGNTVHLAPAK